MNRDRNWEMTLARKRLGMSQAILADNAGVNLEYIQALELRNWSYRQPSEEMASRVATELEIPLDAVLPPQIKAGWLVAAYPQREDDQFEAVDRADICTAVAQAVRALRPADQQLIAALFSEGREAIKLHVLSEEDGVSKQAIYMRWHVLRRHLRFKLQSLWNSMEEQV